MKLTALALVACACAACGSVSSSGPDARDDGPDASGNSPDARGNPPDAAPPDAAPTCGHGLPVHDTLFVTSYAVAAVEIFDCFSQHASGGTGGDRVITGDATGLTRGWYGGVAVDAARDTVYVADHDSATVRVWANAGSVDGNVAPDRVLTGVGTAPAAVAYDASRDLLYVGDYNDCSLRIYASAHTANGAVAPVATLTSATCWMFHLDAANDRLYAPTGSGVSVFDHVSTHSGTAAVTPDRTIVVGGPYSASLDPTTDLLYAGSRNEDGDVSVVAAPETANGTVTPVHTIIGDGETEQLYTVMQVEAVDDQLFALDDGAAGVFVFDTAHTVDGAATPTRFVDFGATQNSASAIAYVP